MRENEAWDGRASREPTSAWMSGKFGLEAGHYRWRHEMRELAAHRGDLTDQGGRDRANGSRGWHEDGLDGRCHGLVHAGQPHFIVEIGAIAQAPDHHDR